MRSLSVIMAGTALSNIIIVITTPILTRLYSPEEFGNLSVFLSILYTISIIASLRYDMAIPLPEDEDDAYHLLLISCIFVGLNSFLTFVCISLLPLVEWFHMEGLSDYIGLLAISLLGIGLFQVLNSWAIRTEEYKSVSKAKVIMNGGQMSSQIFLGLFNIGIVGLLIGEAIGRISGTLTYVKTIKTIQFKRYRVSAMKMLNVLKRYKSFPLVSSWSAILNSLGSQLPVFFLAAMFDAQTVGLFFFSQKILTIFEGLLGFSASQVYLAQSAQYARQSKIIFYKFFWDIVKKMFLMGFVVIGSVALVSPFVINFIFGPLWGDAGKYIQILSVLFLLKIIVNPISANFYVFEALKIQMLSELLRFICIGLSILVAFNYMNDPIAVILCISIISSVGYVIHGFFCWFVMKYCTKQRDITPIIEGKTVDVSVHS